MQEEFAALGVEVERDDDEETDTVPIWDANWRSWQAWLACTTAWRVAIGMAGWEWLGLDYPSVEVVIRRMVLTGRTARLRLQAERQRASLFDDIQIMELAALEAFAEARQS